MKKINDPVWLSYFPVSESRNDDSGDEYLEIDSSEIKCLSIPADKSKARSTIWRYFWSTYVYSC